MVRCCLVGCGPPGTTRLLDSLRESSALAERVHYYVAQGYLENRHAFLTSLLSDHVFGCGDMDGLARSGKCRRERQRTGAEVRRELHGQDPPAGDCRQPR